MAPAPKPADEAERLAALHATGLMDTSRTELFDGFVRLATTLFDAPIGTISLLGADRQWFKASIGMPTSETPRDVSFCTHTILNPNDVMCIEDAAQDPRFARSPLVTGDPRIRFYAGVPLLDRDGRALGALCVMDRQPRAADPASLERLRDIAAGVSIAIQHHTLGRTHGSDARVDLLTGLGTRMAFDEALAERPVDGVSLLLLDLDNLKGINDLFGHHGGDLALAEVGRRLATVSPDVAAFRLEGDEFAMLAPPGSRSALDALAARTQVALFAPFAIDGENVPLRTAIGIASQPGLTATERFQQADAALRTAKQAGRGQTRHAALEATTAHPLGRIDLGQRLRRALVPPGNEPFSLAFQPVVGIPPGREMGMEALVRWNPPQSGTIPPAEFVPLAERIGLVSHLDRWVLREACRTAAEWPQPWRVSVNISAVSFGMIDVAALVRRALQDSGLDPARLTIEMTETALTSQPERSRQAVVALRDMGVGVALDDFGAGNGSLTTLRRFPFSELKIDRGLIDGIATDPAQAHMVGLITQLGRNLGVEVVAEGVETGQELSAVTSLGATHVQGRLLSWPVPAAQVQEAAQAAAAAMARGRPAS